MPAFQRDSINFHYHDLARGEGGRLLPFVFQHGIGGSIQQPCSLVDPLPLGIRLISLDCRAHGLTTPLGPLEKLTFSSLADDLVALLDTLNIQKAVVGGISMGAGVALNVALRYPHRVTGLVLARPAWLDGAMAAFYLYAQITHLLRCYGAKQGRVFFAASKAYQAVADISSDAANSLLGQFDEARGVETIARLQYLPPDQPFVSLEDLKTITAPSLILATKQDPIHPFAYGQILAQGIAGARFQSVISKSVSKEHHYAEMYQHIVSFLHSIHDAP